MRITKYESQSILTLSKKYFGESSKVKLFGSRVDDTKKGGDIDLLIIVPDPFVLKARSLKYSFLDDLQGLIGEQKIDIIITSKEKMQKDDFFSSIEGMDL